jgi:hypothetical protein
VASLSCPGVSVWEVLYWTEPTKVKVRSTTGTGEASLHASPGSLLPTQLVAVLEARHDGNKARHLIGAVDSVSAPSSWPVTGRASLARITLLGRSGAGWAVGELLDSGVSVKIHRKYLRGSQEGTVVMVALVGASDSTGSPLVMPISSGLP